ncbi:hypothetical protein RND81_06G011300 [Saponaria officinalis]|uniref:HMA domain-containing protein n=1 Tax=Saponaria officinalis TaxID=3572 RepID=A0AAW1K6B3_SAPOF
MYTMSTISSFNPLNTSSIQLMTNPKIHSSFIRLDFQRNKFLHLIKTNKSKFKRVSSSLEQDSQIPESIDQTETVVVPVSPADKLIMFFQAEGTMSESAIPTVTQALQGTEGIGDLKVLISEGIANVELTKQTTIQATGVASGLLEIIQGAGFKLNTLNLSFEDEELLTV